MQVGFKVVLLDSKLFPLFENDSTTGVEFWRSTRKIIAVSRTSYEKLAGVPGQEFSQVDDDIDIAITPCKKMKRCHSSDQFDSIIGKLDSLTNNLTFVENVKKMFECIICKSTVSSPFVSSCCQRIIGCRVCVTTWRETSHRCPLCSVSSPASNSFVLKGFDDLTRNSGETETATKSISTASTDAGDIDVSDNSSGGDFEDLSPFHPRSQ